MAIQLKARSTTPGDVVLASGVLSQLIALSDLRLGVGRGDGQVGEWDAVNITSVVAAAWVVAGHENYAGGNAGEYPTTATSQAAQHATDAAFLETNKAEIVVADTAILAEFGVIGAYQRRALIVGA